MRISSWIEMGILWPFPWPIGAPFPGGGGGAASGRFAGGFTFDIERGILVRPCLRGQRKRPVKPL